jgi:ABC-2 type transport system permease protein
VTAETIAAGAAAARAAEHRPGTLRILRWELRKLRAQKRTWIGIGASILVPLIFVTAVAADNSADAAEVPLGSAVRETGLAVPFVGLAFGSIWLFPLIVSLVAGDIVASEDGNGTLKTILTRSVERWQVLAAKGLAAVIYSVGALTVYVLTGLISGGLLWGFDPLPTLSGGHVPTGEGLLLLAGAIAVYAMPLLAVAAIAFMLSVVTRNSAAAVVGGLMFVLILQIVGAITALRGLDPYLLPSQFDAWQGLVRQPIDWAPIGHAAWVSALYGIPAACIALVAFVRRDVTGG